MTNLEKYPNTADALMAYEKVWAGKGLITFEDWLHRDNYECTSLLDVAKEVRDLMYDNVMLYQEGRALLEKLDVVIANEEERK